MHGINQHWHVCARRWFSSCNVYSLALLLMIMCLFLLVINIYELRLMQVDHAALLNVPLAGAAAINKNSQRLPVVWVHGKMVSKIFSDITAVVILGTRCCGPRGGTWVRMEQKSQSKFLLCRGRTSDHG